MKTLLKQTTLFGFLFLCFQLSTLPGFAQSIITTYAGGLQPLSGTQAITQNIGSPDSVLADGAGGFYFTSGNRFYRVAANGVLTVIAGNGTTGFSGDGGPAASAQLRYPRSVAMDAAGNLFVADSGNNCIRKITPDGIISTVAGNGTAGFSGDGALATSARLSNPGGVTVDGAGNVFIADSENYRVRKVNPAGIISTFAGNGLPGVSGDGGPAAFARIQYSSSVAVDAAGNLFIADPGGSRVRKVTPDGIISTFAGTGTPGFSGDGGPAASAQLAYPRGIAVDMAGNLFIADSNTNRIRKVNSAGVISTVAGSSAGFNGDGGPAISALLFRPSGIAIDAEGNIFIADSSNNRVRRISSAGVINTLAGNGTLTFSGDGGPATSAQLSSPGGVAVDGGGNVFIADSSNHRIRKVTRNGVISTFAGNGLPGFSGDGGPAAFAQLNYPTSVAADAFGNVFIADLSNQRIRKVSPDGVITTIANITTGDFCPLGSDDYGAYGISVSPGLAVDAAGNLFVSDSMNNRVRKVTPDGVISTLAGNGSYGFSGDGGPAVSARLFCPSGVAADPAGNLFITDSANHVIRKVTPGGIISTVDAPLSFSAGVSVDAVGNLFIVDTYSNRVLKATPAGIISTVAGNGTAGFSGDGGPAVSAELNFPGGIAVDAAGNLFIADTNNDRIRRVGVVLTVPILTGIFQDLGARGASMFVTLSGTSFVSPLTIDAGSGITTSDIHVVTDVLATATFTIAPDADLGDRSLTVTTSLGTSEALPFKVVLPFPDLSITSAHVGNLSAGFNGVYAVSIVNAGTAATTGALTVTDTLPTGMTFVSGTGAGWSCSASGQKVTCANPESLAAGASTTLTLTVAIGGSAAAHVFHAPAVSVGGDLISSNDTASDFTLVATLSPHLQFESTLAAGRQSKVGLTLPVAFPIDVTGTLTLGFSPNAVIPTDDPTIQLASGGRVVEFTIPANTTEARFSGNLQAGPLGFQPGTVAGTLTFSVTLQAGEIQSTYSTAQIIPRQAPAIQTLRKDTQNGFAVVITLLSTMREVTTFSLRFDTRPAVRLGCGDVTGCSVLGSTMTFDVKSLFDAWFTSGASLGSLSAMRFPFLIQGAAQGSVVVSFRNSLGTSNSISFPLP